MKKIVIFLILLTISSCGLTRNTELPIPATPIILWSGGIQSGTLEIVPIAWTGELSFPECQMANALNMSPEIIKLSKKIEEYADISQKLENQKYSQALASGATSTEYYSHANWIPFFGRFLWEYCSTTDGKYVFYSRDKAPPSFGRYDSHLDTLEEAIFVRKYFHFVWGFGTSGAFWKRNWDIIQVQAEAPSPSYPLSLHPLKKVSNQKYCDNGLTPWGKKTQCFYKVNYEFNVIKNTFTEKNICSFYRDDLGKEQVLEPCFDVKY
jgi:hypothetical protein